MNKLKISRLVIFGLIVCTWGCTSAKPEDKQKSVISETSAMEDTLSAPEEKQELPKQDMTKILLETSLGNITIALYNETPLHRDNFIKLVKEHYYDGLLFHRVIPQFMIQGGDPSSKNAPAGQPLGQGGPGYTIPAEIQPTLYHKRGAVAAARMGDQVNPTKASSGSQFYIVDGRVFPTEQLEKTRTATGAPFTNEQKNVYSTIGGAPHLDGAYTVFGEVISGMDVVDKIAAQPKDRMDRPQKDIVIRKATILENK